MTTILDRTKNERIEKANTINVSLNIPRFFKLNNNKEMTVKCDSISFKEIFLYKKGSWKITLLKEKDTYKLMKEKNEDE